MKRVVLESIEGVEIYPVISLVIFITMFTVALYYAFKMDVKLVDEIASIPLNGNENFNQKGLNHEK